MTRPRVEAVIPARMGSSRFPGKPLAPLAGCSMLEHVYRRVCLCADLSAVHIATCDTEIAEAAQSFGANVIMTSDRHERASDRVAEAAEQLAADVSIVVMVQGDEPMTTPEMVASALGPMADPGVDIVNLALRITDIDEFVDPNAIKVVMDADGDALFFSRQPIPVPPDPQSVPDDAYRQVCVIPFRREALTRFASLSPTPLEVAESIDMLRFLEHGLSVRLVETTERTHPVDTPEDLAKVERMLQADPLTETYLR